ncbi:MAG: hypothetical protein AB7V26_01035 [Lysobacterales bacterium]
MPTDSSTISNATLAKFDYPNSRIHDYGHWSVLLRPAQATLGALVLVCREPVQHFGALSPAAFAELRLVIAACESTLSRLFAYQRINYLMLMMVDPDVHFHVLPRYDRVREFDGVEFADAGWPGPPRLDCVNALPAETWRALLDRVREAWPQ